MKISFFQFVKNYWHKHKNFRRTVGIFCMIIGIIAFLTPLTPGSWLILVGLEIFGVRILFWEKIKSYFVKIWRR
mgnify:CR=1